MDFLRAAVDSVVKKMKAQINVHGKTKEEAIIIVKSQSTAGEKAWEIALSQIA